MALLEIIGNESIGRQIRQSASITFKNLIKEFWASEDNSQLITPQERAVIKVCFNLLKESNDFC
jgi:hypothetical protein